MIIMINKKPKTNSSFSLAVVFLTLNFTFITIPVIIKAIPHEGADSDRSLSEFDVPLNANNEQVYFDH